MAQSSLTRLLSRTQSPDLLQDQVFSSNLEKLDQQVSAIIKRLKDKRDGSFSGSEAEDCRILTGFERIEKVLWMQVKVSSSRENSSKQSFGLRTAVPEELMDTVLPPKDLHENVVKIYDTCYEIYVGLNDLMNFEFSADVNSVWEEGTNRRVSIFTCVVEIQTAYRKVLSTVFPSIRGINAASVMFPQRARNIELRGMSFTEFIISSMELVGGVLHQLDESEKRNDFLQFELQGESRHLTAMIESFDAYLQELKDIMRTGEGRNRNRINELCGGILALIFGTGTSLLLLGDEFYHGLAVVVTTLVANREPLEPSVTALTDAVAAGDFDLIPSLVDTFEKHFNNMHAAKDYIMALGNEGNLLTKTLKSTLEMFRYMEADLQDAIQEYDMKGMEMTEEQKDRMRDQWRQVENATFEWLF